VDHQQNSRTILKAAFVAIAYVVTGKFVVSAFAMLLLTFMTDFAKIALALTTYGRPGSQRRGTSGLYHGVRDPGRCDGRGNTPPLRIGWSHFGLATNDNALYPLAS